MSRLSRINTIWRKELVDTLRDRRTLIAMILVPMVLYPAMMLGSLQALEVQTSNLQKEEYVVAVAREDVGRWLRRVIDSDAARQPNLGRVTAEEAIEKAATQATSRPTPDSTMKRSTREAAMEAASDVPPPFRVVVVQDPRRVVVEGAANAAVEMSGEIPTPASDGSIAVNVLFDATDVRSQFAFSAISKVLERLRLSMLEQRLARHSLPRTFIEPISPYATNLATAERTAGAVLGQIVPLILIVMTITGAIYPAIDLTAGERERGTLETLMVAPVPTVDLITGKFIVVTLIGMLSALLNLLSIGGTVYLGGVGAALMPGSDLSIPLGSLPLVLVMLLPLAVLFSAMLLAVCSFARSFKEAQNYILPVMVAALIPGVVGILPATRLEGPILIMPVANVVVLTRELFLGKTGLAEPILWVVLSTSLYAAAAVAIAARLFGQEAVLFSDSGSIKTLFQRRFFKPRPAPTVSTALLVLALAYTLNFYIQSALQKSGVSEGMEFLSAFAITLVILLVVGPWFAARYARADIANTFSLRAPTLPGLAAGLCFGLSTWLLILQWIRIQEGFLPMNPDMKAQLEAATAWMSSISPWTLAFFLAIVPAFCEEFFFRGFVLSGLRSGIGKVGSLAIVAIAFGVNHHSAHRLIGTAALGLLLGLLVLQHRSIWPAMLAHAMHNGITVLASSPDGLQEQLENWGLNAVEGAPIPPAWIAAALGLTALGTILCFVGTPREATTQSELPARGALPAEP